MEGARQIVRWSIPGGLLVGTLAAFRLLHNAVLDLQEPLALVEPAVIAAAVASSIPLGFLVYQVYFFIYDNGIPWFNIVALDRGGAVIELLSTDSRKALWGSVHPVTGEGASTRPTTHQATERRPLIYAPGIERPPPEMRPRLTVWRGYLAPHRLPTGSSKATRSAYLERRERNMAIVRAWLDTHPSNVAPRIKSEYTTLSDIYHSQGAGRFAVLIALIVDLGYSFGLRRDFPCTVMSDGTLISTNCSERWQINLLSFVLAVGIARLLHAVRRSTWTTARDTLAQSIEAATLDTRTGATNAQVP